MQVGLMKTFFKSKKKFSLDWLITFLFTYFMVANEIFISMRLN